MNHAPGVGSTTRPSERIFTVSVVADVVLSAVNSFTKVLHILALHCMVLLLIAEEEVTHGMLESVYSLVFRLLIPVMHMNALTLAQFVKCFIFYVPESSVGSPNLRISPEKKEKVRDRQY